MTKGMLISFTDIDKTYEEELRSWFVNEHIDERAIHTNGFFRSRLYEAINNGPKFFASYETESFSTLCSESYMHTVSNQTEWSKKIIPKLTLLERYTGKITIDSMRGFGGKIAVYRFLPHENEKLRNELRNVIKNKVQKITQSDWVNGFCMVENDSELSNATGKKAQNIGGNPNLKIKNDWIIIIEGQDIQKLESTLEEIVKEINIDEYINKQIGKNIYSLIYGNNR